KDQAETDTAHVRDKITSMESKIASLESNCLTEVQNLVRNVDILKQELINSQRELESLKEYSRQMEKKREEEKLQILNESRELKLDLSSLRSEIRDKSQGSDRTDQSRGPLTDTRERASPLEKFENQYSPLVGFVGSRCDYLKMKLETLKKHLHNLDCQTQTVLTQSMGESGEGGGIEYKTGKVGYRNVAGAGIEYKTGKVGYRNVKDAGIEYNGGKVGYRNVADAGTPSSDRKSNPPTPQRHRASNASAGKKRSNESSNTNSNSHHKSKSKRNAECNLIATIKQHNTSADDDDDDDVILKRKEDDDEDEIPVLTPRPHRNKYDKDMDTLIVENGENIERLRLPSLEEEEDEEEDVEEEEDEDDGVVVVVVVVAAAVAAAVKEAEKELSVAGLKTHNLYLKKNIDILSGNMSHRDSARGDKSDGRAGGVPDTRDFARSNNHQQLDFRLESPRPRRDRSLPRVEEEDENVINSFLTREKRRASSLERQVDSRFERLEQELENRRRKGPMPAYHHLMPKSAH
ncbi:hypothetical protein ElyMa_006957100, partial [Elysia marginata]